jgi:hypothetical protein
MSKALREAFISGAQHQWRRPALTLTSVTRNAETEALAHWPKKTETRPRVVSVGYSDPNPIEYRLVNGEIQQNDRLQGWIPSTNFVLQNGRLEIVRYALRHAEVGKIIDLVNNPTETVEIE